MQVADEATMTPAEAMDEIHRAIGILSGVRAWMMRHEEHVGALNGRDAHQLACAQWTACAAGQMLAETSNAIGRMDLRVFGKRK